MTFCPKCGTQMPEEAKFCMKCGRTIGVQVPLGIPHAGVILLSLAAILMFLCGIFYTSQAMTVLLRDHASYYYSYYSSSFGAESLALGILCIVGFAFGILSSVLAYGKKKFYVAIIGSIFIIVVATLTLFTPFYLSGGFLNTLGMVTLILSILGTVFLAISKNEFSNKI